MGQMEKVGGRLLWLAEVDSTNTYLKEHMDDPSFSHGTAVYTDCQTAGKGRRGNSWGGTAPSVMNRAGASLALSFLLRGTTIEDMGILPLLVASAACRGLKGLHPALKFGIKWPNDIICQEKKLCGILCESRITGKGASGAVCGIGVNLTQTQEELDITGLPHAISLGIALNGQESAELSPEPTARAILEAFEDIYQAYRQQGFEGLLPEYKERCVTLGKRVRVIWNQKIQEGTALDITPLGELACSIEGKVQLIRSGEASVRGMYGYI